MADLGPHTRVTIYARKSTEQTVSADQKSVTRQVEDARTSAILDLRRG